MIACAWWQANSRPEDFSTLADSHYKSGTIFGLVIAEVPKRQDYAGGFMPTGDYKSSLNLSGGHLATYAFDLSHCEAS